jgi:DNA-directed RNA polymerase subunit L
MEINIITDTKEVLEVELDNLTVAEVLRMYLNEEGAKLAVWKRDHPSKNPVLHIEDSNPKKVLKAAISKVEKDIDSAVSSFKKLK